MAQVKDNPFSNWIQGSWFDNWVEALDIKVSEDPPELLWIDLETTGLDSRREATLMMGLVLTDRVGNVCRDGVCDWLVWGDFEDEKDSGRWITAMSDMDPFCREMHTKNGLIQQIRWAREHPESHRLHPAQVAVDALEWLRQMKAPERPTLSGANPASFDRQFVQVDMPILNNDLHYRAGVDVSSLREVAKRTNPLCLENQPTKEERHLPIADILDSIKLYQFLLRNFLIIDDATKELLP